MRLLHAAALLAAALGAQAAPVAFVADVRGAATIEGDGKLTFLAELSPGARLMLGSHASAAITYASSGAEFALSGPGQFLVTAEEVTAERGAKPTKRTVASLSDPTVIARASQTATASLRMRSIAPDPPAAALVFPVSTRVSTLKPALRWRPEAEEEHTLVVMDASGREVWRARSKTGSTRLAVALAPGSRYSWTVRSSRGSLGEAYFETLATEAIGRADRSRAAAKSFPDRVMNALLLQEIGAQQEAREAWAELARERPDLPELPALAR